jgi:hypothetical protein
MRSDWTELQCVKETPWLRDFTQPFMAPLQKPVVDNANSESYLLVDLILASNYLSNETVFDYACMMFATTLMGKPPHEVRVKFGIAEPSREEERKMRIANRFVFDVPPHRITVAQEMARLSIANVNNDEDPAARPLPDDTDSDEISDFDEA